MSQRLYVDGGVIGSNPSPHDGTWAWCLVDEANQIIASGSGLVRERWPEILLPISNNVSELAAMLLGMQALPAGWSGQVYSDSRITLGRVFECWALKGVPSCLRRLIVPTKARLGVVTHWLLKGHPSTHDLQRGRTKDGVPVSEWNVYCDSACQHLSAHYRAFCITTAQCRLP